MLGYVEGYTAASRMQKEAGLSTNQMAAALGGALGLSSGLLSNFLLSKLFGYKGDWKNYLAAGATGAGAGAAAGIWGEKRVRRNVNFYKQNPKRFADILEKVEKSPRLEQWHEWQKKSPLMKPIRQAVGRVVTNVKKPEGYQLGGMQDLYRRHGIKGILDAARHDYSLWDTESFYNDPEEGRARRAREVLLRKYFDLPSRLPEGQVQDIYTADPTDPKTLRFNPEGEQGAALRENLVKDLTDTSENFNEVMGGYNPHQQGSYISIKDPWDFHTHIPQKLRQTDEWSLYGSLPISEKGQQDPRRLQRERALHHLRNIVDRAIGNPVTVSARIPTQEVEKLRQQLQYEEDYGYDY